MQELRRKHSLLQGPKITQAENARLLEEYWEDDYQYRDLVDPESMYNSIVRSLAVIGPLSLITADKKEILSAVKKANLPTNTKRTVVARLNQLLKFAGRGFTLRAPKREYIEVRYISESDLKKVIPFVPPGYRDLALIAFATGMRVGEIFSITRERVFKSQVLVVNQMRDDGSIGLTKNRKQRTTICLDIGLEALDRWLDTPLHERAKARNRRFADVLKKACKKAFPDDPRKHLVFHDLRHSFAIALLGRGASISEISKLLGDSVQVSEAYYIGFSLAQDHIDDLIERLRG